jgi:ribonuclease PH
VNTSFLRRGVVGLVGRMQQSEILALAGLRIDGRRFNELRKIKYKLAVSQQQSAANGSTYLEQGLNKVLIEIYGPKEMKNKGNDISMVEKVRRRSKILSLEVSCCLGCRPL